jgi:hypothetical protein
MVELFLCGFVESKRWMDFRKPGSQAEPGSFLGFESSFKGTKNGYPGGIFDPLGLTKCAFWEHGGTTRAAGALRRRTLSPQDGFNCAPPRLAPPRVRPNELPLKPAP